MVRYSKDLLQLPACTHTCTHITINRIKLTMLFLSKFESKIRQYLIILSQDIVCGV